MRHWPDRQHPHAAGQWFIQPDWYDMPEATRQPSVSPPKDVKPVHEHQVEFRVRYKETDAMGFVHHSNYLTYFEMGRTEMLRASGVNYKDLETEGLFMVVVRIQCRFHKPARYDDVLRLETHVTRVSAAKIEHRYDLYRDEELLAQGTSTLACLDREGVVQRVPEWLQTE